MCEEGESARPEQVNFNPQEGDSHNDDIYNLYECLNQSSPEAMKTSLLCTEMDFIRKNEGDGWNDGWYDSYKWES